MRRRTAAAACPGSGAVEVTECKLKDADVVYRAYALRKGRLLLRREGSRRLRQRAPARPQQPDRGQDGQGRDFDRDHRRRRPRCLRPSPGGHACARQGARGSVSPQQRRQLCRGCGVLRRGEQRLGRSSAQPRGSAGQRSAAKVQPRPVRRGQLAVLPRCRKRRIGPHRRSPAAQLSRHSRPQPGGRQERAGRARQAAAQSRPRQRDRTTPASSRSTAAWPSASMPSRSSASSSAASRTSFFPPKRPRYSTARHSSCAARRCG